MAGVSALLVAGAGVALYAYVIIEERDFELEQRIPHPPESAVWLYNGVGDYDKVLAKVSDLMASEGFVAYKRDKDFVSWYRQRPDNFSFLVLTRMAFKKTGDDWPDSSLQTERFGLSLFQEETAHLFESNGIKLDLIYHYPGE